MKSDHDVKQNRSALIVVVDKNRVQSNQPTLFLNLANHILFPVVQMPEVELVKNKRTRSKAKRKGDQV